MTRLKNKGFVDKTGKEAGYSMKEHFMFLVYNLLILGIEEKVELIYDKLKKIECINNLYWSFELNEEMRRIEFKLKYLFDSNDPLEMSNIDKISCTEHFCPKMLYYGIPEDVEIDKICIMNKW